MKCVVARPGDDGELPMIYAASGRKPVRRQPGVPTGAEKPPVRAVARLASHDPPAAARRAQHTVPDGWRRR